MRQKILTIAFLLIIQLAFSQVYKKEDPAILANTKQTVSIDPVYFVLGTLNNYMARFSYVKKEKQIDRYYPFEKPMVNYLTSYIKSELNIPVDTIFEKSNYSEIYCDKLSKKLNSFYGEKDELLRDKFQKENQFYSFVTGSYYRYGEKLDASIYKIQLTNAPNNYLFYEFLIKVGCENILYEYSQNIPAQFIYYFEATDELKKYFDTIEFEKEILKKSFYNEIEEIMQGSLTQEEIENIFQNSKNKEVLKFKNSLKK